MRFKQILSLSLTIAIMFSLVGTITIKASVNNDVQSVNNDVQVEAEDVPPYLNTSLSFEERAADLVSRMTLEEKVTQTGHSAPAISRLGVHSYYYWREGLHGVARQGKATSFPTSLSMSNTWDRQLIWDCANITSDEARAKNNQYDLSYWSPTINMARDPLWGRNDETYGEDPYLTGQIGEQFVKGMQGDDSKYQKVIATLKHFAANNCEGERGDGTSYMDESTLKDYYLDAFKDITERTSPGSVMSSYNATTIMRNGKPVYDYIASSANEYLLTDQLRRNWGFDGYVTGDCGAFGNLFSKANLKNGLFPGVANVTPAMTMAKAFNAGNNIDCGSAAQASTYEAVQKGYMSEDTLDRAVYELFLERMRTGEFDDPSIVGSEALKSYRNHNSSELENEEHIAKAEEAAEKSWVMLKNEDSILPIKKTSDKKVNVALVGSRAGSTILGDYSGSPDYTVTPYDGITQELGDNAEVSYLGGFSDSTKLFNLNNIIYTLSDGSKVSVKPGTGGYLSGATKSGDILTDVTKALDVRYSADCSKIEKITVNVTTNPGVPDCTLNVLYNAKYGEGPNVCSIKISDTNGKAADFTADYTGASGGYNSTSATLYLGIETGSTFSVDKFKSELDAADVIVAYAGTTLADASESNDRESLKLPDSQSHVKEICAVDDYAKKTVVIVQSVGQVDTSDFANCKALLWNSYNGQTQGTAIGKVLSGKVNPSGKLTTTWYNPADMGTSSDGSKLSIKSDGSLKSPTGLTSTKYNNYNIKNTDKFPGRTYQYYTGTPVYPFGYGLSYTNYTYSNLSFDKNSVDANGTVEISVDVTNNGTVNGDEIVQMYVTVPENGENMPEKQLKGFERVSIDAGQTKTVKMALDISDCTFFSESEQKMYVPNGEYTISVGGNSESAGLINGIVNVSGKLSNKLKTLRAMPSGINVTGVYNAVKNTTKPSKDVLPNLSAIMDDESEHSIVSGEVVYESSNNNIAKVSADGTVSAGTEEGVATITATATIDGVVKTESFPVVCSLTKVITEEVLAAAKAELKAEFDLYNPLSYSTENYEKLTKIYTDALAAMDKAFSEEDEEGALPPIFESAKENFLKVETLALNNVYKIASENEKVLVDGVIDYREGGIEPYVATSSKISGTVTGDKPFTFQLVAKDGNETVDPSSLTWSIERLDGNTARKSAEISSSGEMSVYGYGIYKVKAANPRELECGEMIIFANLQLEAETCDDLGGARLETGKGGASGTAEYNDIGSSGSAWITYHDVKLGDLKEITLRLSMKSDNDPLKVTYVSLAKNTDSENLLTSVSVPKTGSWTTWTELTGEVNQDALDNAALDENGLGTIYVQTNTANFDFMKFTYGPPSERPTASPKPTAEPSATPLPSATPDNEKTSITGYDKNTGIVSIKKGIDYPTSGAIAVVAGYTNDGVLTDFKQAEIPADANEVNVGAVNGDVIKVYLWDSFEKVTPICEAEQY